MYKFKQDVVVDINKTKASKVIGITRQHLTNILNKKTACTKVIAYCITKYLNEDAEIKDYFDRIGE